MTRFNTIWQIQSNFPFFFQLFYGCEVYLCRHCLCVQYFTTNSTFKHKERLCVHFRLICSISDLFAGQNHQLRYFFLFRIIFWIILYFLQLHHNYINKFPMKQWCSRVILCHLLVIWFLLPSKAHHGFGLRSADRFPHSNSWRGP